MFPLEKLPAIQAAPENYRLLTKLPEFTGPVSIRPSFPDSERNLLVVDVETTGKSHKVDEVIEIGFALCSYLPAAGYITRILKVGSFYNEPKLPISQEITDMTGITNEMVAGHYIDYDSQLAEFFEADPLVVAHWAPFDRPFVDPFLPPSKRSLQWACSCSEIDWRKLGHEGGKLKYLGVDHGFFFEGHRASADCLAVAWMLAKNTAAFRQLLSAADTNTIQVEAVGSPFPTKDLLSARGYRWNGERKVWSRTVPEHDLGDELAFLDGLPGYSSNKARLTKQNATERFKEVR